MQGSLMKLQLHAIRLHFLSAIITDVVQLNSIARKGSQFWAIKIHLHWKP